MNDYNTVKPSLILKEYGRNIQMLVAYLDTLEDREKRSEMAATLIELMKLINPSAKDAQETAQKLWDDLYIMSDFGLDIDGPYPKPDREILNKKPDRLGYRTSEVRFKHYGRNIELLIQKAIDLEDAEEKEAAIIHIGRLMKGFQFAWNRDIGDEGTILKDMRYLSKNKLDIDLEKVKANNLFDPLVKEQRKNKPGGGKGRRNTGRRRRN